MRKIIISLLLLTAVTFPACMHVLGDPIYVARGQVVDENGAPLNNCELFFFSFKDGGVALDRKDKISSIWTIYGLPSPESINDFFVKISCGDRYYEYYSGALEKFHPPRSYYYDLGVIVMRNIN